MTKEKETMKASMSQTQEMTLDVIRVGLAVVTGAYEKPTGIVIKPTEDKGTCQVVFEFGKERDISGLIDIALAIENTEMEGLRFVAQLKPIIELRLTTKEKR